MIPAKHLLIAFLVFSSVVSYAQFRLYEKGHDSYTAGKYDETIVNLTEYLTKSTRDKAIDIDVFYIRALAHYKLNHYSEAIPDFEETILRGHANKGNIYWFMAKCYDNLKNNGEALNSYNNAIRELRDNTSARAKLLHERSRIHAKMGEITMALVDLNASRELDPSNAEAKNEIAKLEKDQPAAARQAEIHIKETRTKNKTSAKADEGTNKGAVTKSNPPVSKSNTETSKPADDQKQNNTLAKKEKKPEASSKEQKSANERVPVPETKTAKPVVEATPAVSPLEELYKEEKRYALVIGNSAYPKQIGALKNPLNDATDIAKELKASNFEVTLLTNATYGQIRAALMKFKESLDGGDPEKTVGLFYYAGHGLQFDDENYLVPVDASVEYEDDIPRYCFPINRMVLANMERSSTRMNIVILDACRNNPFPSLNRSIGNAGLGEMKRAKGSFIAYATSPGSVASDGTGRNGLYTQELLKALRKDGLTIEQVFKEVRANVLKLSNNKQNTWDSSNIVGEFHFKY